jgi:dihydropteroate synthase
MTAKIVGILNITPDSFSDGGEFCAPQTALKQAKLMIKHGASVIDIGAEATGPNASPIQHNEEWERLEPTLKALQPLRNLVQISVDTRHPSTAANALKLGTDWINDVSGFEDPLMIETVKVSNCKCVFMHNLGVPAEKNRTIPTEEDPATTVFTWAQAKINQLVTAGINKDRLIFDPGLGFGKTAEQSLLLVQATQSFKILDVPIYIGHSRKSFLSLMAPEKTAEERDPETYTVSAYLNQHGAAYLRVHDVAGNLKAIRAKI